MDQQMIQKAAAILALLESNGDPAKALVNNINGVNGTTLLQQPGGIFTVPGLDNAVISTHVRAEGIGAMLPAYASDDDDPRYGLLVGVSDTYGTEPVNVCDEAPSGYIKSGTLTAQFGHVTRGTAEIVFQNILMRQRGASENLRLLGDVLGSGPMVPNMSNRQILNSTVEVEMMQVGVQLERALVPMVWQGTPANNTAGGGYKEFPGLDSQIATGQVDAETNTAIPSADSLIFDFAKHHVDDTSYDIVAYMSEIEFQLNYIARRTGLNPVTWVICMTPQLWQELSALWPCRYLTNGCNNLAGDNPIVINDDNYTRMRDDLRNNLYLPVNGKRYQVVLDDGMREDNNATASGVARGQFMGEIVWLPLRVAGNFPATYWEYLDYQQGLSRELGALPGMSRDKLPFWTDGGRFLWSIDYVRTCFKLQASVTPRVVLRTPHLAARIQNIIYEPLRHVRSPFPDSPYWVDGGVSMRPRAGTGYAVWK